MTFACPQNVSNQMLRLSDLTSDQLENITVFIAQGLPNPVNASQLLPGPFTSIPPNICMMPNLIVSKLNTSASYTLPAYSRRLFLQIIKLTASIHRDT